MTKRVASALSAAGPAEIAQMTVTSSRPGGGTATAREWSYGDRWRSVVYSLAGQPVFEEGGASSTYTLVNYPARTWARQRGVAGQTEPAPRQTGCVLAGAALSPLFGRPLQTVRRFLVRERGPAPARGDITRATDDAELARTWFERFEGAGLDGVIAKPLDGKYRPGDRVMVKIKHDRTADVVVAGYRHHKSGPVVGSLMLGLYGADGVLNYVGGSSAFTMARRAALIDELAPLRLEDGAPHPWLDDNADEEHRRPGAQHRWNAGKDTSFIPLRPERVCEVNYDQLQADRFRHNARFVRWRPDRDPLSCRYDQLDVPAPYDFADVID